MLTATLQGILSTSIASVPVRGKSHSHVTTTFPLRTLSEQMRAAGCHEPPKKVCTREGMFFGENEELPQVTRWRKELLGAPNGQVGRRFWCARRVADLMRSRLFWLGDRGNFLVPAASGKSGNWNHKAHQESSHAHSHDGPAQLFVT
jgi:hypothetical protein